MCVVVAPAENLRLYETALGAVGLMLVLAFSAIAVRFGQVNDSPGIGAI
jgi:hypothetical protein